MEFASYIAGKKVAIEGFKIDPLWEGTGKNFKPLR
jgi:hypothetical protein